MWRRGRRRRTELFADEGIQVDDEQVVEVIRAIPAEDVESPAVQADGEFLARWDLVTADLLPLVRRRPGIEDRKMRQGTMSPPP